MQPTIPDPPSSPVAAYYATRSWNALPYLTWNASSCPECYPVPGQELCLLPGTLSLVTSIDHSRPDWFQIQNDPVPNPPTLPPGVGILGRLS